MSSLRNSPPVIDGGPVWPLADLFPLQGQWTESAYLLVNRPGLELKEGRLEFHEDMPTFSHSGLAEWLRDELKERFGRNNVRLAGYARRIGPKTTRRPDLLASRTREGWEEDIATAADLVLEVVSRSSADRERDFVAKRADYASVGVSEYWIADPCEREVVVLALDGNVYREHGRYSVEGGVLTSPLLPDLSIDVGKWFAEAVE